MEEKVKCDTIPEFHQDRDLVCVEYPGIVKNIDTVIKTLGGMNNISKTHQDDNKRLDLHFRPDDPCCRPVCADRFPVSCLLLKVRKYKKKKKPGEESKPDEYRYRPEIAGVVETAYRFSTLCDFQFLPLHNDVKNDKLVNMLPCLGIKDNKFNESIFTQDAPLFLPPATFSRIDTMQDSLFKKDVKPRSATEPAHRKLPPDKIGVRRPRRSHNAQYIKFTDDWTPATPLPSAVEAWKNTNRCTVEIENIIKKMFEERPIWSKNAIVTQVECHPEQLKSLLPTVAYYFLTGPWRALWVRFDYDPRKHPSAVKYQLLDFRLRQGINTPNIPVKARRSTLHYKLPNMVPKPKQSYIKQSFSLASESKDVSDRLVPNESVYIYKPGVLPAYRQMFYQVCDIKHPDVASLVDPYFSGITVNAVCHPKSGWFDEDISSKVRDILSKDIQNTVRLSERAALTLSERASLTPNLSKNGRRRKNLSKQQVKMLEELESQSDYEEYERSLSSGEEEGSAVENLDNFVAKRSAVLPETSSQEEEDTSQNREAILRGNVRSQEFSTEDLIRAGSESQGEFTLEECVDDEENLSIGEGDNDDMDDMVDFLDDFESLSQELDSDGGQT